MTMPSGRVTRMLVNQLQRRVDALETRLLILEGQSNKSKEMESK